MKTVSVRVQDDVYMQFRKHLLNKAIDNGMGVNMSAYIVKLIENDMNNTQPLSIPSPPPSDKPNVEQSQHLKLSDLDW